MGQIKLRISDEELVNAACTSARSFIECLRCRVEGLVKL